MWVNVGTARVMLGNVLFILPAAVTGHELNRMNVGHSNATNSNANNSRAGQRPQTLEWYVRMLTPVGRVTSRRSAWSASFRPPLSPPAHQSAAQARSPEGLRPAGRVADDLAQGPVTGPNMGRVENPRVAAGP